MMFPPEIRAEGLQWNHSTFSYQIDNKEGTVESDQIQLLIRHPVLNDLVIVKP